MRILAALFGILAVTVWWGPMPRLAQSLILILAAVLCLAFREAQKRLGRTHAAVADAKDLLRQIRDERAADPQARSES